MLSSPSPRNTHRFPILLLLLIPTLLSAQGEAGAPLRFFAVGDAGAPGRDMVEVAQGMTAHQERLRASGAPASLLLFLGDNFYPNGLNRPPEIRRQLIDVVLTPYVALMTQLGRGNVHAITGNHDYYCTTINEIPLGTCRGGNLAEQEIPYWTYHLYAPSLVRRATTAGGRDSVDFILFDSSLLLVVPSFRWRAVLDSMERLLRRSAASPSVRYRLLIAHHSPYYIGEHGGWRRWIASEKRIGYIGNCISDGDDPIRYLYQFFSNQDNCTPDYREYTDSLMATIARGGALIHAMITGHDHSLQLMYYPDRNCASCPKTFIVSGSGSKRATVKPPAPPHEFSHPINTDEEQGRSVAGYLYGSFEPEGMVLSFHDGPGGTPVDMGSTTRFVMEPSGRLRAAP